MQKWIVRSSLLLGLALVWVAGCSKPAGDADPHSGKTPDTLSSAVSEIKELRDKVVTAMESDDHEAAHEPLHEIGHVLDVVEKRVEDLDVPAETKAKLSEAVDTLIKAFMGIDDTFHEKEGVAIDDVRSDIDSAIATLEAQVDPSKAAQ